MRGIWPLAIITFKEGIRNRAIYGIALMALLFLVAGFVITGMIPRSIGKVAVDMSLSVLSLSALLVVLFVGINLMAKDLDRRTIYMVLARPISRAQYIVGKFLGISFLVGCTVFIVGAVASLFVYVIQLNNPEYVERLTWWLILIAILYTLLKYILLTAISFLFASFVSSSFVTLVMTAVVYLIGTSLNDVKQLVSAPAEAGIQVSSVTVKIVNAAYYVFPNLSFFDLKSQAAYGVSPSVAYLLWVGLYGVIYTVLILFLSSLIFRRREFP